METGDQDYLDGKGELATTKFGLKTAKGPSNPTRVSFKWYQLNA